MKANNNTTCKCAFCWCDLDNAQRKKVIKRFEEEYGDFFAKELDYGNKYDPPPVKEGKKLSSKRNFDKDSLGYYCNDILDRMFTIRTMHDITIYAPYVKEEINDKDIDLYCTAIVAPDGAELIEQCFLNEKNANKAVKEFNKLFCTSQAAMDIGFKKQVIKKSFKAGTLKMWKLYEWNGKQYVLSKEWPIFLKKKFALDRAEHNLRFNVAFWVHWESWKDAGYKDTRTYDYTKEQSFPLTKKNLLAHEKTMTRVDEIHYKPFGKKLLSPKVDEEFIEWCKKEL